MIEKKKQNANKLNTLNCIGVRAKYNNADQVLAALCSDTQISARLNKWPTMVYNYHKWKMYINAKTNRYVRNMSMTMIAES